MARPPSTQARFIGFALLLSCFPLTLRLIWEMTLLTWQEGEQMIGFSIAHTMPGLLVIGFLGECGAIIWCLVTLTLAIARRRLLGSLDWALFTALVVTIGVPIVPYSAWQWTTFHVLGPGRPFPPQVAARQYNRLITSARSGDVHALNELLRRGLSVDGTDDFGRTALYAAAEAGSTKAVESLVLRGARVNLQIKDGETPLHAAAREGHLDTVKALVAAGADPSIRTNNGKGFSAADLAWPSHPEIVSFLEPSDTKK